ncbi:MAG: DUF4091 domain-containing protein [Planctomycetes bacterium]|nr:DUF4091 domain-containing protein [Planctomycetota bacterium]
MAVAILIAAFLPTADARSLDVWVEPGSTRIGIADPPGAQALAEIEAARGEVEPFQIALRASPEPVANVRVACSDLAGPDGARIPASEIRLYREAFVYVRRPSPRSSASPGLYPDALLPFRNPIDGSEIAPADPRRRAGGALFIASPFTVWPGGNEVLWFDVSVPHDARPGSYEGKVSIRAAGAAAIDVPVRLRVRGFALPETPTLRSCFGGFDRIAKAHGVEPGSDAFRAIEIAYCEAMAQHRITPPIPAHLYPAVDPDGTIRPEKTHPDRKAYIDRLHVNAFPIRRPPFRDPLDADRERAIRYFRTTMAYLRENGWARGAYWYALDEPNDPEAYETVRQLGRLAHDADPDLPVLITEQTKSSNEAWGTLEGAVDIWVPLWPLHDAPTAARALERGEEIWSYTALCQGPDGTLWWQLDFPLLDYRVALWGNWRCRMTGLLYWTAVYWDHAIDPWLDQPSFRGAYNGEGMLLYPGTHAGFAGPVPSMRLKMIREGIEDYEYLVLLEARAGREAADREAAEIFRSWQDWERDPEKLLATRRRIAQRIEAAATP